MLIPKIAGLLVLLLIVGFLVFGLYRADKQENRGIAHLRRQSLGSQPLRVPNRLPEQLRDVSEKKSPEEEAGLQSSSSLSQKPASVEKPAEPQSVITVVDGRLSVQVHNRPLQWVLEEIAQQSGLFISAEHIGEERISVHFQDVPLDQGLQHLLKDQDAFFFHGAEAEGYGTASLRAVWVYAKGKGRRIFPVPPEDWASTQEIAQGLTDPDPEERARTIEALVDRGGKQALEPVMQALRDQNEKVRYRALYKAVDAGLALPADSLQTLLHSDSSPVVRFLALNAIAEQSHADSHNVKAIAEFALNDPSPHVQEQAREILSQVETASRLPDHNQPLQEPEGPASE